MSALQRSHVNESAILDYVDGRGEDRERVELHLDECSECRQLVAELAQTSLAAGGGGGPWHEATPTEPQRSRGLPEPGALLAGRYRIGSALGHGAMGMVYEAVDEALGSTIAIKVFWPHLGEDPRVLESIRREANLGRRIQHPNVRRVFDVATSGNVTFLTMELVDGETLEARLARGMLTEDEAIATLAQVADALTAAHAAGIVHRDLKPGNIAIDRSGRVIVMDFGLARDVNAQASRNQGRGLVGTPAYWSPEQSRGEPATAASDVYSLGLVAYRLLTGQAFSLCGDSALPPRYRRVVDRCLEQRPQSRYSSAAEVKAAFDEARGLDKRRMTGGLVAVAAALAIGISLIVARATSWHSSAVERSPATPVTGDSVALAASPAPGASAEAVALSSMNGPPRSSGATAREAEAPTLSIDSLPSAAPTALGAGRSSPRRSRPPASARPAAAQTAPALTEEAASARTVSPPAPGDETTPKPQRPKRQIDREDPYSPRP